MYLTENRRLRLTTFALLYFAQGIPIGLFTVAFPVWLAAEGASVGQVSGLLALVGLPWAFKLVAGPFMDRFRFPSMGRRRPWVMAAQAGLAASLLLVGLIPDPVSQITLLGAVGFVVNTFAATQDVAVDGMAIDVLPVAERGRANALMAFGQVAGYSSYGALTTALINSFGPAAAALFCSLSLVAIFAWITVMRERVGERRLPWSAGQAAAGTSVEPPTFASIVSGLLRVLLLPMSLILVLGEFINRMRDGISVAVAPVFAVQELGVSSGDYANAYALMGVSAAVIGALCGPLIDRVGARRFLLAGLACSALLTLLLAVAPGLWDSLALVAGIYAGIIIATQFVSVGFIALFMNLCSPAVAATQFAIYMALANLSRSFGGGAFALFADSLQWQGQFAVMAGLLMLSAVIVWQFDPGRSDSPAVAEPQPG